MPTEHKQEVLLVYQTPLSIVVAAAILRSDDESSFLSLGSDFSRESTAESVTKAVGCIGVVTLTVWTSFGTGCVHMYRLGAIGPFRG